MTIRHESKTKVRTLTDRWAGSILTALMLLVIVAGCRSKETAGEAEANDPQQGTEAPAGTPPVVVNPWAEVTPHLDVLTAALEEGGAEAETALIAFQWLPSPVQSQVESKHFVPIILAHGGSGQLLAASILEETGAQLSESDAEALVGVLEEMKEDDSALGSLQTIVARTAERDGPKIMNRLQSVLVDKWGGLLPTAAAVADADTFATWADGQATTTRQELRSEISRLRSGYGSQSTAENRLTRLTALVAGMGEAAGRSETAARTLASWADCSGYPDIYEGVRDAAFGSLAVVALSNDKLPSLVAGQIVGPRLATLKALSGDRAARQGLNLAGLDNQSLTLLLLQEQDDATLDELLSRVCKATKIAEAVPAMNTVRLLYSANPALLARPAALCQEAAVSGEGADAATVVEGALTTFIEGLDKRQAAKESWVADDLRMGVQLLAAGRHHDALVVISLAQMDLALYARQLMAESDRLQKSSSLDAHGSLSDMNRRLENMRESLRMMQRAFALSRLSLEKTLWAFRSATRIASLADALVQVAGGKEAGQEATPDDVAQLLSLADARAATDPTLLAAVVKRVRTSDAKAAGDEGDAMADLLTTTVRRRRDEALQFLPHEEACTIVLETATGGFYRPLIQCLAANAELDVEKLGGWLTSDNTTLRFHAAFAAGVNRSVELIPALEIALKGEEDKATVLALHFSLATLKAKKADIEGI